MLNITSIGDDAEKWEPLYTAGGNIKNGTVFVENSLAFPQNAKLRITI